MCWIIVVAVVAGSCLDDADCLRTGDDALVINFKRLDGRNDTLVFYNIAAEGTDSIFYKTAEPDERDTLHTVTLAVNPFEDETLFTFYFETETKTLRVGYKNEVRFVSEDCGTERVQHNLKILETGFDSVRVVNSVLSTSRTTNIEIYH